MRAVILCMTAFSTAAALAADVRLYTLDCGAAEFADASMLSDTGHYDGRPGRFANPCFLVRHPDGWFLWDTGIPDAIVGQPVQGDGFAMKRNVSLVSQLRHLGITPEDIRFLSFSHLHFDHTGNAALFPAATWLIQRVEWSWAHSDPVPFSVAPDSFSAADPRKLVLLDGDHDVFGDGSVRILRTPGHTPGHQVLAVTLPSGFVILGGDLYHSRESRKLEQIPTINVNRSDTLASFNRIENLLKNKKGRLVIQHDRADFDSLPKFPEYLD